MKNCIHTSDSTAKVKGYTLSLLCISLLCLFVPAGNSYAQKNHTIYYSSTGKVTGKPNAHFYSVIIQDKKDTLRYRVETFLSTGNRFSSGSYLAKKNPVNWVHLHVPGFKEAVKEGTFREYHDNGQIRFQGDYLNGMGQGRHQYWYRSGQLASEGFLKNGRDEGLMSIYYENGNLKIQYYTVNGRINGDLAEFFQAERKSQKLSGKTELSREIKSGTGIRK